MPTKRARRRRRKKNEDETGGAAECHHPRCAMPEGEPDDSDPNDIQIPADFERSTLVEHVEAYEWSIEEYDGTSYWIGRPKVCSHCGRRGCPDCFLGDEPDSDEEAPRIFERKIGFSDMDSVRWS